jgi:CheY-like chemotaxis protein
MSETDAPAAKLLIVEDVVFPDAEDLKGQLIENGYEVIGIAQSTDEAIKMARTQPIDLALIDLKIPLERDGELSAQGGIRAAKEIQRIGNIGVVYITAEPPSEEILQAVKRTSPDAVYVTKPYSEEQVLAAVRLTLMTIRGTKVVFLCYPRKLESLKDELVRFLQPLEGFGIDAWHDKKIAAGAYWRHAIEEAINHSTVAILLINIDFVNSTFIKEFELPKLLKAAEDRGHRVIPVYAGFVPQDVLQRLGLLEFQGINDPAKPLGSWKREVRERMAWGRLYNELLAIHSGNTRR